MKHITGIVALSLILATGCGKSAGPGGGAPGGRGGPAGRGGMPPMPVETAVVEPSTISDRFQAVGTIEADEAITVVSEIDGVIAELPFREGGMVRKGDLLARLDDAQLAAEVDRASAMRDQSKSSFDRIQALVQQKAAAPQDLDDASGALKVAEANLAVARARLDKTRITAPFAGTVGARQVSVGAFLRAGQPITELAQLQELRVNFAAPERFLPKLIPGAEVTVSTTAYPGYEVRGKILVVDPVVDPGTRSAQIVARVNNPGNRFRPGMSADISAVLSERSGALTVPNEAVFVEGSQAFVYRIKADSTVTRVSLELGTRDAEMVEVLQGLDAGARIVRAGHQKLFEGAKVMPVSSQQGGPGASGGAPPGAKPAGDGTPVAGGSR